MNAIGTHTPAPWLSTNHGLTIKTGRGDIVCHVRSGENIDADARLIAAAPELLAALKGFMNNTSVVHGLPHTARAAAAAIAKAEGRI